jgi:hypothetical protein
MRNSANVSSSIKVVYSQSNIFSVLRRYGVANYVMQDKNRISQTTKYEESQMVRVIMTDGQAYWIRDNMLYSADINDDYSINVESTKTVDTMTMDSVQLKKIVFVVDKLTEGLNNDNSSSWDKEL